MGYNDKDFTDKQIQVLATNKDRNKVIMQKLRMLYKEGKPTIVFACSVNHAKMLSAMLTLEEIPNSLVLGEMEALDRKKAIDVFKDRDTTSEFFIFFFNLLYFFNW